MCWTNSLTFMFTKNALVKKFIRGVPLVCITDNDTHFAANLSMIGWKGLVVVIYTVRSIIPNLMD